MGGKTMNKTYLCVLPLALLLAGAVIFALLADLAALVSGVIWIGGAILGWRMVKKGQCWPVSNDI